MARKRYISTDISLSGKIEELARRSGDFAVILFTWMIPHADDWGRMEGDPAKVFYTVTPRFSTLGRTPEDVEQALQTMHEIGLLHRYKIGCTWYIQFNMDTFYEYQTYIPIAKREQDKSSYPAPELNRKVAQNSTERREVAQNTPSPSPSPSRTPTPTVHICASDDAQKGTNGRAAGQDSDNEPDEQRARTPFKSKAQEMRFDEFWKHYPKKRSKGRAEKAWVKITPDAELFSTIMDGLGRAKKSRDWTKDGGEYIPYPATWLNAKGWEDEYDERRDRHDGAHARYGGARGSNNTRSGRGASAGEGRPTTADYTGGKYGGIFKRKLPASGETGEGADA